jgi:hypothetical protein
MTAPIDGHRWFMKIYRKSIVTDLCLQTYTVESQRVKHQM